MDYDASSSTGTQGPSLSSQKEQIINQVRQEVAFANAQALLTKMNEKCFVKCISKPGSRLDSSEQTCLAKCMDRYMESWNVVSRAFNGRAQREAAMHGDH